MSATPSGNASASLEQILPAAVRARLLRWAPYLLFLGLLVLCGYLAARLSWQFVAPSVASAPAGAAGAVRGTGGGAVETPGAKIAAAHLFGSANAPAASVAARNAPETSLDLGLAGVAAANGGTRSYAIISSNGNTEDTYAIGAQLPGGALIRQILPDRVVIAHGGRLETLRLPISGTSIIAAPAVAPIPEAGGRRPPPLVSKGFREQIENHPQSFFQYARLRPYEKNGHLAGYRIYPGPKPELFKKAGLRAGDIVTGVNGIVVDSQADALKAMQEIRKGGPVRLEILRQGHQTAVTVNAGSGG